MSNLAGRFNKANSRKSSRAKARGRYTRQRIRTADNKIRRINAMMLKTKSAPYLEYLKSRVYYWLATKHKR